VARGLEQNYSEHLLNIHCFSMVSESMLAGPEAILQNDTRAYRPLSSREIRLLHMSPVPQCSDENHQNGSPITIVPFRHPLDLSFHVVTLERTQMPDFVALSYAWGDLEDTTDIQVSGESIRITRKLYDILQCLSLPGAAHFFWIDALCINQDDVIERSAQVLLMRDVYSLATSVLVFLSPISEPFDIGMTFLEKAALHPEMHYSPPLSPCIMVGELSIVSEVLRDSFISFFAAPWWTRIWPVQEYVLAKQIVFQCGQRRLDGSTVRAALKSLVHHERTCCWAARRAIDGDFGGYLNSPSMANGGLTIFHATLRLDHLQSMVDAENYPIDDLVDAMALFRNRECSDPRDRIFGMLGLKFKDETLRNNMEVDYSVSAAQLYEAFTMEMIEQSQSLDVLSDVLKGSFTQERMHLLPSWVPDWTAKIDDSFHLIYMERRGFINRFYASGQMKPVWKLIAPGKIFTKAIIISKIADTAPGYPADKSSRSGKLLLKKWRQLAGLHTESIDNSSNGERELAPSEEAFRNLLCGSLTLASWSTSPSVYEKVYQVWKTWFTNEEPEQQERETRSDAREFDNLVRYASFGRKFFVSENGLIGFGPEAARIGDTVAIFPGGKVPYILRTATQKGGNGDMVAYRLLGDANVQGLMSGEITSPETSVESVQIKDIILL
jgi:hypothetical protein